ncbi:MAG: RsmF rRNA methyltransferase first C-terminal domain-containing protein [Lachnospiraceae bacterium]|nr:RsmF rRNA methyltransferase first C-terminal domain-containing protein [Lachnospiraceae bacterium]
MEIPAGFLSEMEKSLGEEYGAFLKSLGDEEVKALRINPLKGFKGFDEELIKKWCLEPVSWEENGFFYRAGQCEMPPGKHPLHEAGAYYIQEPSAMYPVSLLEPKEKEKVLDLCAAPGGKSTQIALHMKNTGLLISNEIILQRALVLSQNIERMGVKNAVVTSMEPERLASFFSAFFDKVLVDAPCSGEGMMRRGDAARENWSMENVNMCAARQHDILNEAAKCLKPGGRLVYSTCTFSEEEDEKNVERFLREHTDYELLSREKLYPHKIRGEGHFAAVFLRKGSSGTEPEGSISAFNNAGKSPKTSRGKRKGAENGSGAYIKLATGFLKDFLSDEADISFSPERMGEFKESVYLYPEGIPDIRGMKVIRPGLRLGTVKKGRFEPDHCLAMSLKPEDVKKSYNISSESPVAADYLKGMTINLTEDEDKAGPDGWYLITVDNISIGLGKKTGGIIKNHYPKGLRR